ncbi:hypothetical protein [Spirosoma endophyticum]|nr:hypothetical protein [Spirosoma endophyticum]
MYLRPHYTATIEWFVTMDDKTIWNGISAYFSTLKIIGKPELDAYGFALCRLHRLAKNMDVARLHFLKTKFTDPLAQFLVITQALADYADNSCWCDLNEYYAIQEFATPTTDQQLFLYVMENHQLFLDIIAKYREMEGIV